jgi:hypothetical protein
MEFLRVLGYIVFVVALLGFLKVGLMLMFSKKS